MCKYTLSVYVFQNWKGWPACLKVMYADIHNQFLAHENEQCLHHRQNKYYSSRDPLEARGEAAVELANDLRKIVERIRDKIVNPGSMGSVCLFQR